MQGLEYGLKIMINLIDTRGSKCEGNVKVCPILSN